MRAAERSARAGFLINGPAFCAQQIPVKHIMNERGFAGPGDAGHAREDAQRDFHVNVLQIMLARAGDPDR